MLSGFWAAVENVLFLLFYFSVFNSCCVRMWTFSVILALWFFFFFSSHSALFARSRFCFFLFFFPFCRRGSAGFLTQQLSFTSFPLHLIVTGSFCTLLSCFCFCIFLETFAERFVPTHPPVTIHEGQVNAGGADSTPAPSSDGGRRGDGRWDTREVKLG